MAPVRQPASRHFPAVAPSRLLKVWAETKTRRFTGTFTLASGAEIVSMPHQMSRILAEQFRPKVAIPGIGLPGMDMRWLSPFANSRNTRDFGFSP